MFSLPSPPGVSRPILVDVMDAVLASDQACPYHPLIQYHLRDTLDDLCGCAQSFGAVSLRNCASGVCLSGSQPPPPPLSYLCSASELIRGVVPIGMLSGACMVWQTLLLTVAKEPPQLRNTMLYMSLSLWPVVSIVFEVSTCLLSIHTQGHKHTTHQRCVCNHHILRAPS